MKLITLNVVIVEMVIRCWESVIVFLPMKTGVLVEIPSAVNGRRRRSTRCIIPVVLESVRIVSSLFRFGVFPFLSHCSFFPFGVKRIETVKLTRASTRNQR